MFRVQGQTGTALEAQGWLSRLRVWGLRVQGVEFKGLGCVV